MRKLTLLAAVTAFVGLQTACTTTIRNITAQAWRDDGNALYVGYWEGDCKPILGCGVGNGKVQLCTLQPDNSLACSDQESVNVLLATKNKAMDKKKK